MTFSLHFRLLAAMMLLPGALLLAQEDSPAPKASTTHREAALALIDLLRQTEACLARCTDAAQVQAALPHLRRLAEQVHAFKRMQDALPEPTTQDYMAAQDLSGDFNTVWEAIRSHIRRLESAKLITRELRDLLVIAPSEDAP